MSREYRIESSHLPLSYFGGLSHPAVRGVYLEELPYSVSGTSEISSDEYSVIEDGLMNVEGISDISCPFTHSYAAYIYISEPGTYRFYVHANFGAEATIYDGEHGVSTGVTCGAQAESSSVEEITFADRGYYKVEVKYYSTGEASPVLELHFGESSPDMASRSELPVFRDFYILETEYATLLGDGSVLRPGETCTIDLHNISEYYSIYGGSVTVWRADGVKTYPLEYDRVTIPMASILAGWLFWSGVGASNRLFPGSNLRDLMWGGEIRITNNLRIAPFGNRTGNPLGERPHYHRRVVDSSGITKEGQGIGRHRPYETKSCDKSFWDRF